MKSLLIGKIVSKLHYYVVIAASDIIYYSGLIKLISFLINRFEANKKGNKIPLIPFLRHRICNNIQIITYHRVNDYGDQFFPGIPVKVFESHMKYLANNYHIYSLEEIPKQLKSKQISDNSIVITFDDGYKDIYTNAFPILYRMKIPATVFLPTGSIGSDKLLWHDQVFCAFRNTNIKSIKGFGPTRANYSLGNLREKLIAKEKVLKILRSLGESERFYWVARLTEMLDVKDTDKANEIMLSWDEVKVMHKNGMKFGSHTETHPILKNITYDRIKEEVEKSKWVIEKNLQTQVETFAYPNGSRKDFDENVKEVLKKAGYSCAVTTIFGTNTHGQDLYELKRGGPWEHYLPTFALKLNWQKYIL